MQWSLKDEKNFDLFFFFFFNWKLNILLYFKFSFSNTFVLKFSSKNAMHQAFNGLQNTGILLKNCFPDKKFFPASDNFPLECKGRRSLGLCTAWNRHSLFNWGEWKYVLLQKRSLLLLTGVFPLILCLLNAGVIAFISWSELCVSTGCMKRSVLSVFLSHSM